MISLIGDNMTDTQILFRMDSDMLKELDTNISGSGFKTRNEWFRNVVRDFLEDVERKKLLKKMEKLNIDKMTEAEVAEMVNAWRTEES